MRIKPLPIWLRIIGIALPMVVGLVLELFSLGEPLVRLSYDWPFLCSSVRPNKEVVLVYIDEHSVEALNQSPAQPFDRALYGKLLDRLTRDGARAVYLDIVFEGAGAKPESDQVLADAIRRNGRVIIGEDLQAMLVQGVREEKVIQPYEPFRNAAAATGLLIFRPIDPDYSVRSLYCGDEDNPTASWAAAAFLKIPGTNDPKERVRPRWMNYYGPTGTAFQSTTIEQALLEDGVAPGFFHDKIVLVGKNFTVGGVESQLDSYVVPYLRFGYSYKNYPIFPMPGVEVHATELLNLLRHDWLERLSEPAEAAVICLLGALAGLAAAFLAPKPGACILGGLELAVVAGAIALPFAHLWYAWCIPALVQIPLSLAWSSGLHYLVEARKRAALRNAFAFYLSPVMADKIADSDFDLKPGGKLVDASILFTDCQGFTTMSEELNDPAKISETLIAYFTKTSKCVLDHDGTIIKYIGDAVMATWGAPLEDPAHEYKAALAAWEISEVSKLVVMGRVLTTRVGVSSGSVLHGNLGSPYRFDYTCTGEAVNFASRLEGMNKFLGTSILISDSVQKKTAGKFITRLLGNFAVAGKSQSQPVHELIIPADKQKEPLPWIATFDQALTCVKRGEFEEAVKAFREVVWQRGGTDGPSEFYISRMAQMEKEDKLREWTGVIKLSEK